MSRPSVIIIGGTGLFGNAVVDGFVAESQKFERIAVLADPSRGLQKYAPLQAKDGLDVVVGSPTDPLSYKGMLSLRFMVFRIAMFRINT
jgi:uncharacterized protein YbjT (DUF2867 family)